MNKCISWKEYFMNVALLTSKRSKDLNTQVGACIVNNDNRIISTGYNGFVNGCGNDDFPKGRDGEWIDTKYPFVVHAEQNAILNAYSNDLKNCTIYVTLFPCNECAKAIVQAGIKHIIYLEDKYKNTDSVIAAKKIFDMVGVSYEKYEGEIIGDMLRKSC